MKFRVLLYFIFLRLRWLSKNDARFKEKISDRSMVLVFGAADRSIYRHYRLIGGRIESGRGLPEKYDLSLEFKTATYGYRMLTQKANAPMSFAKGMNKREIVLRGNMDNVFWLMGIGKHLPLKRKKLRKAARAHTDARAGALPQ